MRLITSCVASVAWRVYEGAMTLLLIPGFMADATLWDAMTDDLAPFGPLVATDLSRGEDIERMAASILSDAPERFVAVGFSMGGYVARELARIAPERVEALILIATSARQIGMFLVILAVVSAAIVAFIIYTLTMDKIREIAVLKLIGTRNRTIAAMILQQAVALGLIGFVVGKIAATWSAPFFPKYVLLVPADTVAGFAAVMAICVLASLVSIRLALRVDPAEAIGG